MIPNPQSSLLQTQCRVERETETGDATKKKEPSSRCIGGPPMLWRKPTPWAMLKARLQSATLGINEVGKVICNSFVTSTLLLRA